MRLRVVSALVAGVAVFAQTDAPKPLSRLGEQERLGEGGREVLVLGADAPGFDKLRPSQRKLAYFLSRAAIAGNDIQFLQNHRTSLDIRNLLEAIHEQREGLDPQILEGLEEYLKLVWIHHGQYRHWHHTKFTPRLLTFEQLKKAAFHAKKKGAKFDLHKGESLDKLLLRLRPHIFDPKVETVQVNQTAGADPIATSSNGFYDPGLKLSDIEALPKELQTQVNVRFAAGKTKKGKKTVEAQTFKIGGVYGDSLANVSFWLKKALAFVENERVEVEKDGVKKVRFEPNPQQKKGLEDLIAFLDSGDEQKFKDHSVAWLKTKSVIDYLNGFYETYKDPRGVIGSYSASVSFRADSDSVEKLSQNALYFEAKMPWKDAWKRAKVDPPVASVVNVLIGTGDSGPVSYAAFNLPNYDNIRKEHGSKNVILLNLDAPANPKALAATFLPEDVETIAKFGDLSWRWTVYMHEVIGHGSGQPDESLGGAEPNVKLGTTFNALEECRADAVALYQFLDPKVVELGVVKADEHETIARAMYVRYLGSQLMANGRAAEGIFREAHDRGRQLVLTYLVEKGFGVKVVEKDGHHFVQLEDLKKAREGVGEILAKLQTFKSMGDKAGAEAFFAEYGTKAHPDWTRSAKARIEALGLPKDRAWVYPQLVPILETKDERQVLKDVLLETKETLAEQMARFKRLSRSRDLQ